MERKSFTLVWDIDDVLNGLTREWLEHAWLPTSPSCRVRYEELSMNPPHEVLGISMGTYLASLDEFRASHLGRNLAPSPQTLAWFERYGSRCRHLALTMRPLASAPSAADWVIRHYGRWIRAFGFVPSPRPGDLAASYDTAKADWLRWISIGDVMIDDSLANLEGARSLGLRTVIAPQPWNGAIGRLSDALDQLAALLPPC